MVLTVTPIYAALIAVIFLALSFRVIAYRRAHGVSLGDDDSPVLRTRIRAQGNAAEYAPLGVILLLIAELQGAPVALLHGLGLMLVVGRAMHAVAFGDTQMKFKLRAPGMVLTLTMLMITTALVLILALF
ncbi:MAG: MAPEG family protein [Marinibacterium sp.]|nr:MAPEG family protein [Marinibacterium sp.]